MPNRTAEDLQRDCSEAYQAVGRIANALGWWDMPTDHPWYRPIEKLLDNLSAAANGEPRPHDNLLPFYFPIYCTDNTE